MDNNTLALVQTWMAPAAESKLSLFNLQWQPKEVVVDYKANIVKPVFVKVQEADSISLHRSVIENIVINLDKYKNKVDAFILKIGDANYYEIGRINTGIIFKIVGTSLPQENGLYYILNEDGELVTTGKYTIA